jgi:hypothetical protein
MTEPLLTDELTEAVLSGTAERPLPAGLDRVATLARAARAEPSVTETEILPSLLEALAGSVSPVEPARRSVSRVKRRVAVVAGAVVLTSSGMAAAATTDHLPRPVQRAVASVASHVGIDLPRPSSSSPAPARDGRPAPPSTRPVVPPTASTPAVTAPGRGRSGTTTESVPPTTQPGSGPGRPTTGPPATAPGHGSRPDEPGPPPVATQPHDGGGPPSSGPPSTYPGGGHGRGSRHRPQE